MSTYIVSSTGGGAPGGLRYFTAGVKLVLALGLCFTVSCGPSEYKQLARKVQNSPPEELHRWASEVLDYSRTNTGTLPTNRWPECIRDIIAGQHLLWDLSVVTNESTGSPYVSLISPGGFESIGVLVGSETFVPLNLSPTAHAEKVSNGVYLFRMH